MTESEIANWLEQIARRNPTGWVNWLMPHRRKALAADLAVMNLSSVHDAEIELAFIEHKSKTAKKKT